MQPGTHAPHTARAYKAFVNRSVGAHAAMMESCLSYASPLGLRRVRRSWDHATVHSGYRTFFWVGGGTQPCLRDVRYQRMWTAQAALVVMLSIFKLIVLTFPATSSFLRLKGLKETITAMIARAVEIYVQGESTISSMSI